MINLLGRETRAELAAARRNVHLRGYVFTMCLLGAVITASYAVGYYILTMQADAHRQTVAQYVPEKAKYQDTIKEAAAYSANLAIAKSISTNEFSFSDLTITISRILPPNAVLNSLNVASRDFGKPIEIDLSAKSYNDVVAVKRAFQSSPYFKDTMIRTTAFEPKDGFDYPYSATIITTLIRSEFMKAQKEGRL